jgi:gamma-glutamyltranspeptidase/glutathione hydrolase
MMTTKLFRYLPLLIFLAFVFTFHQPSPYPAQNKALAAKSGLVVTVSAPASDAGLVILKEGGNAVDAAVATAFALAVTYPQAGNLGGGGFMVVHPADGKPVVIEYRETAPGAATRDMFAKGKPDRYGHLVVGVPGTVRGMALAHQKYGKLPWKTLVMPAVRLAEKGFTLDAHVAKSLNAILKDGKDFAELQRVFSHPKGEKWAAGDKLVQPDLAKTLRLIADNGPDAFYTGLIADQLAAEMKTGGGLITKEDLAKYQAKERQPIHGKFRGHDVYGPPPPSSGGIALVEMLNILENFDLKKQGRWSPATLHLLTETMRRAYYDRAKYLGDADFVEIPKHLTGPAYAKNLASEIDLTKATRSEDLARDIPLSAEGESTTHFSVIDRDGMAVSNTYTLEQSFGSRVVVKGAGFLLNNEMGDFNWRPGFTDRTGNIGTEPNTIAPGKRMLSSMTPTIVAKNGKVVLVTGSPGGRTIINTVLCVVLNVIEFDRDIQSAVAAPRSHPAWFPDKMHFDGLTQHPQRVKKLQAMGHQIDQFRQGDAHSIWVDRQTSSYHGAADKRLSGKAAGY